jgi:hypothetical protein
MLHIERMIATLEVEAKMIESHSERLVSRASELTDLELHRELLELADEESIQAGMIRHQIRLLQDHLAEEQSDVA